MSAADPQVETVAKERVSTYLYFSSLYFVTVAVLYLWGYWAAFDVNILEYLSLADVLKVSAYPIASAFIFSVIGAVIGEFLIDRRKFPPGGGSGTLVGNLLRKLAPLIVVAYLFGTIALLLFGPVTKWRALPFLFAIPVYMFVKDRGFLSSLIPHDSPRSLVLFLLAVLPTWAYGHGRLQAATVLEGTDYKYVVSEIEGITVGNAADPKSRIRYIGHASDYVFLLLPDNSTLAIIRFDQAKNLQLKRFKVSTESSSTGSTTAVEKNAVPHPTKKDEKV